MREERRKIGERTDRFLGKYDVDSKSSANLGPTASSSRHKRRSAGGGRACAGQTQVDLEPVDEPTLPS